MTIRLSELNEKKIGWEIFKKFSSITFNSNSYVKRANSAFQRPNVMHVPTFGYILCLNIHCGS